MRELTQHSDFVLTCRRQHHRAGRVKVILWLYAYAVLAYAINGIHLIMKSPELSMQRKCYTRISSIMYTC